MNARTMLRIAAGLTALHAVLHTLGAVFGKPSGPAQQAAVTLMKATGFDAARVSRSYWDFFFGYGLFVTIVFLAATVIFWQLSSIVQTNGRLVRPIIATFCLCF